MLSLHVKHVKFHAVQFVEVLQNICPVFSIGGLQVAANRICNGVHSIPERAFQQRFPSDSKLRVEANEDNDAQCHQIEKHHAERLHIERVRNLHTQPLAESTSIYPAERMVLMNRGFFASSPIFLRNDEMCTSIERSVMS